MLVFPFCLLSKWVGHLVGRYDVKILMAAPGPHLTSWVNQFGTICLCFLSGGGVQLGLQGREGRVGVGPGSGRAVKRLA